MQPLLAAAERVRFASASGEGVQGELSLPKGNGPFPAVVLLHSCLGLPANRGAIESALVSWGYAALFVDDFSTRGLRETCTIEFAQVVQDGFGALAFLARRSEIDSARVAAVGFSQGGDAALKIAASPSGSGGLSFRAAAAFYAPCDNEGELGPENTDADFGRGCGFGDARRRLRPACGAPSGLGQARRLSRRRPRVR